MELPPASLYAVSHGTTTDEGEFKGFGGQVQPVHPGFPPGQELGPGLGLPPLSDRNIIGVVLPSWAGWLLRPVSLLSEATAGILTPYRYHCRTRNPSQGDDGES